MIVYIASAVAFALAVAGMAIGVILSNRRIKGTCGGLNNQTDEHGRTVCGLCSDPAPECRGERELAPPVGQHDAT